MSEIREPHWRDLPDASEDSETFEGSESPESRAASRVAAVSDASGTEASEPDTAEDVELEAFWQQARTRARFDWIGAYGGSTVLGSLRPPAWSFGGTPEEADSFVAEVLRESAVATAGALSDYEAEGVPQPEVGAVSIVLDGSGSPCALVATSEVSVMPLAELEHEDVAVPVEGGDLTPETQFVVERLTLLYPTKRHR